MSVMIGNLLGVLNPLRGPSFVDLYGLLVAIVIIKILKNPGADYQEIAHNTDLVVELTKREPLRTPVNKTFSFIIHSHADPGWLATMQEYEALSVSHILNSSTDFVGEKTTLQVDHDLRKFTFDALSFIKSWISKNPEKKSLLKDVIDQKRFNLINGGISMHDQACCYLDDIIANYEYGREYTKNELGRVPIIAWSVDPFGASRGSARLFAEMGFDALGLNRIPPDIKAQKRQDKELIFWWRNSNSTDNDLMTITTAIHYATPFPFNFHGKFPKNYGPTPPNTDMLQEDFNLMKGMIEFVNNLVYIGDSYQERNVLSLIGDDFAFSYFSDEIKPFDQILSAMACNNETGPFAGIDVQVKTLQDHLEVMRAENKTYKVDELSDSYPVVNNFAGFHDSVWTGFFTTRPFLKGMIKLAGELHRSVIATFSTYAIMDPKVEAELVRVYSDLQELRFDLGILQHHDAITGTCHKHVVEDYLQRIDGIRTGLDHFFKKTTKDALGVDPFGFGLNKTGSLSKLQTEAAFTVFNYRTEAVTRSIKVSYPISLSSRVQLVDEHNKILPISESCDEIVGCDAVTLHSERVSGLGHRTFRLEHTQNFKAVQTIQLPDSAAHNFSMGDRKWTLTNGGQNNPGLLMTEHILGQSPRELHISLAAYDVSSLYHMNFISGPYCMVTFSDAAPVHYSNMRVQIEEAAALVTVLVNFEQQLQFAPLTPWSPLQTRGNLKIQIFHDQLREVGSLKSVVQVTANLLPILRQEADVVLRYKVVGLKNEGKFYVDTNGLEALEHRLKKDKRIEYSYQPVSKFIQIRDPVRNLKMTVLNDRAQGGTSPAEGVVELDIARANNGRDMKGMWEPTRDSYHLSLHHTVILEPVDSFEFRKQQVAADNPLLYMHHKPGKVNGVKRPPSNNSLPEFPYLRIQLEVKPDGYLVRFYNMHDEQATTVPCLFDFLATLYSIDRPFSLQPRSLDYTLTREDVMAQNYLWRNKTSVLANMQEVHKGKPWTIGALSMATYRLSWI